MRINRSRALFIASLCLASFLFGIAAASFGFFPYRVLVHASSALVALVRGWKQDPADYLVETEGLSGPTVRRRSEAAGTELILVAGGEGYLRDFNRPEGCLAWI